jgi:hypothetical protein
VQSPRKMSSHSRRIRLPREPEAGLGTSYHSMSSTFGATGRPAGSSGRVPFVDLVFGSNSQLRANRGILCL